MLGDRSMIKDKTLSGSMQGASVHNVAHSPMQTTVAEIISFDGVGLHSGRFVRVAIHPAPANAGILFRRIDVTESRQTIAARPNSVRQARLCTRIVNDDGVGLETV
ncbi:MAG: UDP-3-O-acyl-N-acetylglucosamine deacetylase, partial [Candidatus Puniceispirillaceae bacterium]